MLPHNNRYESVIPLARHLKADLQNQGVVSKAVMALDQHEFPKLLFAFS